jgi:FtsP/CotA-like multicopper oxidase with cupredoxin domain
MLHDDAAPKAADVRRPGAEERAATEGVERREILKLAGLIVLGSAAAELDAVAAFVRGDAPGPVLDNAAGDECSGEEAREKFPVSPLILTPFMDELPIPAPLKPVPKSEVDGWLIPPGNGVGQQDSYGSSHQVWTSQLQLPDPIIYKVKLEVGLHRFTTSKVQPIDSRGRKVTPPDRIKGPRNLPGSTIYGFNGQFPGPMIYGRYGQPALVRFENHLDENPMHLDRQNFGSPDLAFLTHLHNGHTAPESDGNPHFRPGGYQPGQYVDNLYLNWPAGGDPREKQSFFWFHDHRMDHTGANVYKGMVGTYPLYDPVDDAGDETIGFRLPGVPNLSTGRVDYDIPLVLYDCCLDDGVTRHKDFHNGCDETHPEWWGKTFFRHFPNKGFVGDIFTVNGTAYPVLEVKRRKYRFRFLDASVARIYELKLMSSSTAPVAAPGKQGQFQLPNGQQCMRFTQVAVDGGLLPYPVVRNSFELWPAKRREVVIDFTRYLDGTPTTKGDVIYLVNCMQMLDGRQPDEPFEETDDGTLVPNPDFDPNYRVPILKIVIGDSAPDNSLIPQALRPMPEIDMAGLSQLPHRTFELKRDDVFGGETQWLINGLPFDPLTSLAYPKRGRPELWTLKNGGGGWVHPVHMHMEEHRCLTRDGAAVVAPPPMPMEAEGKHVDDLAREDVVALGPNEEVTFYRNFRTFVGPYVAHCHNLAHEDHAMMFGWKIVP